MKFCFSILFFIIFSVSHAQTDIKRGIFDIQDSVMAISKMTVEKADGYGENLYVTQRLANGNLSVKYIYNKTVTPNPIYVSYSFNIESLSPDSFAIDIQAAMPFSSLYVDTNFLQQSYIGSRAALPNVLNQDSIFLPVVQGVFSLKNRASNKPFIDYAIVLSNRKFVKKGNISVNGKTHEIFEHSYNFSQRTTVNGKTIEIREETVTDRFGTSVGFINQERIGKLTALLTYPTETEKVNSIRQESLLLNIQN